MRAPVLSFTDRGIYCPAGDFFVDPWRPVPRALITHGHADHARPGMGAYLTTDAAAPVLRHRLGRDIALDTIAYGETRRLGGASVSFHPAGHVPGSAQIRIEVAGEVWVVSGDYKTAPDGLSEPFEPVPCHTFISECTFGLPVFRWQDQARIADQLAAWWQAAREAGQTPVLGAYSLGKAQRLLSLLDPGQGPILTHGAVEATTAILRDQGYDLPETVPVTPDTRPADHPGALVLCPPAAMGTSWSRRFGPISAGFASGWMQLRGIRRRRAADRGFVISDHADWDGLNAAITATGAETIYVTHGYTEIFSRWLVDQGHDARILPTEFGQDEDGDAPAPVDPAAGVQGDTSAPVPGDTNVPVPGDIDAHVPGDNDPPVPQDSDAPAAGDTNTPIPGDTNARMPDTTNAPAPGDTDTPVPGDTDTPIRDDTNGPAPGDTNTSDASPHGAAKPPAVS